jgi:hypothetical protein
MPVSSNNTRSTGWSATPASPGKNMSPEFSSDIALTNPLERMLSGEIFGRHVFARSAYLHVTTPGSRPPHPAVRTDKD